MKYETIDEQKINDIMEGREPKPPADWDEPSEPGKLVQREVPDKGPLRSADLPASTNTRELSGLTIVSGHAPRSLGRNRMQSRR